MSSIDKLKYFTYNNLAWWPTGFFRMLRSNWWYFLGWWNKSDLKMLYAPKPIPFSKKCVFSRLQQDLKIHSFWFLVICEACFLFILVEIIHNLFSCQFDSIASGYSTFLQAQWRHPYLIDVPMQVWCKKSVALDGSEKIRFHEQNAGHFWRPHFNVK